MNPTWDTPNPKLLWFRVQCLRVWGSGPLATNYKTRSYTEHAKAPAVLQPGAGEYQHAQEALVAVVTGVLRAEPRPLRAQRFRGSGLRV